MSVPALSSFDLIRIVLRDKPTPDNPHLWYTLIMLLGIPTCQDVETLMARIIEVSMDDTHQVARENAYNVMSTVGMGRLQSIHHPSAC